MTIPNGQGWDYEGTTAVIAAQVFTVNDFGRRVKNTTTNAVYTVFAAGTGVGCLINVSATQYGEVLFSLHDFREVTSGLAVANIAGNGGILASDTTPVMGVDAAKTHSILWAASNSDVIATQIAVPSDVDFTRSVFFDLTTVSAGTTNAATITVDTYWNSGTVLTASCVGAATTTVTTATATFLTANLPTAATRLTLALTPAAHTTDTMSLFNVRMRYFRA